MRIKMMAASSYPSSSKIPYHAQLSDGSHVIASFYLVYPDPINTWANQSVGCDMVAQTTEYHGA